ncbi:meiosis regulator and mRNA stability factor 1 isoform X2 [Dendroctonus ponderosae]|uniref:meiosis regulator and mRNA stability factor 1 isoform X2 n=1 Tax=Dendroctonus ponderosae TaxID=77166 RepID=UPI002034B082|nr:meiosis regulator and mRNA stability factor 1 isoform X2 [Dendroctonus ponderosae]
MASEAGSSDSNELDPIYFERLNLSDCTGARRKLKFTPRRALSANNSFNSFQSLPHSDESSTTCSQPDSEPTCKKYRKKTGFVNKMPPMGIFWDIENVGVPKQKSAAAIVEKIRGVFLKDYRESEFMVVCDVKKEQPLIMQELHDSQVNLIHVSSTSKNAADDKLRQSLRRFSDVHPAPSAILLITGDINFAADLFDLRYRKKIRVILVHNVNVSDALILSANDHYIFTNLIQCVPSTSQRKTANSHTYFYLTIHNLPKNIDQRKVKNRLGFLTNNCGGKCVEFLNEKGIACFRFGNFDLALRAHKRIQGEDVFGQKISVLAPSVRSYTGQREKKSDLFPQAQQGSSTSTRFNLEKNEVFPQINSAVPPPPGLENRSTNAYPYSNPPKKRQDFTPINKRKPPISMDRLGHPNFRPILRSGSSFSGSCVSPMELSYDQTQIRRSMSSKHNSPQDQQGACALSPYYRSQASGSSEFSDSDGKGYISSEISRNTQGTQPVDLTITNLDATIDVKELKRLLTNMIMKYVMVLHLNIVMQSDGTPVAHLRVRSQQEAQFIISQLHRQKLGHKRIIIAYEQDDSPDPEQLKVMVISVLQDAPNKSMHLFKFMELLESRYHCTVSISEVNKLKNVVCISDERGSRVISLTEEAIKVDPSYNLSQPMIPQCVIHCPKSMQTFGWCELNFSIVPNVLISLSLFTAKLMTLLNIHFGSMPLISFETCYDQVFEDPLPVADSGVPLEHLITCVPGVEIKLVGPNKSIKVIQHEVKENEEHTEENVLKAVAPSLASNVSLLCREVVDLLKNLDKCQILLTKFIPAYHHHFGRQCRVADYGYTKLLDLFEAISHVVQIMGDGSRRVITLTHSSQMRRFISDLLRVLKVQPNKQIAFTEFAAAYERTLNKPFNPVEYGLCTLDDLLCEVPENTIVITKENENIYISVPKREQTAVEIAKTKEFANEVINLLRHTPYSTMFFNKFVPSYHHHFGHQCKVSDYGFTKLIELFEAIPDVVEIKELPDGERTISLTLQQSLKILSAQVLRMIRNTCGGGLKLDELPMLYFKQYGYPLNPQIYQCESLEELVSNLSEYVQVIHSNAGSLLRPVEMDTSQSVLRVRCWAMLLVPPHVKNLVSFRNEYRQCYGNNFTTEDLRKIANVVSLSSMHNIDYISLTSLYVLAAQIYCVICNHGGSVEYNKLEQLYEESYGKPMKLSSFNINSVNEFYNRFNLLFYVRGSKKNSIVVPNRNLEEYIAFKYHNNNSEAEQQLNINNQWSDILSGSSDQEQGAVKKYTPPKPDTPPSPGSTLWWNSPSKLSQEQMNFFIDMPLTMDRTLHEMSKSLISPARYLLFSDTPWNLAQPPTLAPDPHELPIPNKLLPKAGMSDDSGDSGVNILADHSHSDSDLEPSTSKGAIKKKHYNGTFLNFK